MCSSVQVIKSRIRDRQDILHIWGKGEVHTGFWWESLRKENHLEDPGVDKRIILKLIFKKWDGDMDWIDLPLER
jgi:hypothetical protein